MHLPALAQLFVARHTRLLAGALVLSAAGASLAQTAAPAAVPAPPQLRDLPAAAKAAAAPASAASAPAKAAAARTHITVTEDDDVRIEETRVRGQVQRILVQSKVPGAPPYEIIVGPSGKDASQDRGAVGQRAWSLFSF